MEIKIKVCGLRDNNNIREILTVHPDFIGFILYPGSKRYVGEDYNLEVEVPASVNKVGVFVNALIKDVFNWKVRLGLDFVQLHGTEPPEYCKEINNMGLKLIKAFGITQDFNFSQLKDYIPYCDYFLFDTKTPVYGGSGQKFDWEILNNYLSENPFFLSGGIKPDDIADICKIKNDKLFAIDINSGFETAPAMKDIQLINQFVNTIRSK
jgi:phosphoribosylanthranilate isomerase